MSNLYKCDDCGTIFNEDDFDSYEDPRGEFWGQPCYETIYICPCCGSDCYEEYEPDEDEDLDVYDPMTKEEDSMSWRMAEERYLSRCMEMNCEE